MEATMLALCSAKMQSLQAELNRCSDEIDILKNKLQQLEERRQFIRQQVWYQKFYAKPQPPPLQKKK